MQSHGITLSFHREMADSSRELVGPDITAAVTLRVIHASSKAVSRITRVSGSKDPLPIPACSLPTIEVARKQRVLKSLPESSRIFGINWNFGRSFQIEAIEHRGTSSEFLDQRSNQAQEFPGPLPAAMRKAPISTSATCPPEGRLGSCLTNTRPVSGSRASTTDPRWDFGKSLSSERFPLLMELSSRITTEMTAMWQRRSA